MNKKTRYIIYLFLSLLLILPSKIFAEVITRDGEYPGLCYKTSNGDCKTVDLRWYLDESGNSVNCLSPGQCFGNSNNIGGHTGNYAEKDMSSVLDKCLSAWAYKDGSETSGVDAMFCGEAVIYQYSYEDNLASGLEVGSKNHSLAQQIALRMWEASVGANWNTTNGTVDGGVYKKLAVLVQNDTSVTVNDSRVQAIVGGDQTSMNIVNAAINYFKAAQVGGKLHSNVVQYDSEKSEVYGEDGEYKLQLDSNISNGAISSIKLEDGTVLSGNTGNCKNGESNCMTIDLSSDTVKNSIKKICTAGKASVKITVDYTSNDAVTSMKRYYATDGNGAGCQQMITFDKEGKQKSDEVEVPCEDFIEPECVVEEGICKIGEEVVECASTPEEGAQMYPDTECYCYYDEETEECKVGDTPVDCEEYPGCNEAICIVEDGICKVGDEIVPCAPTKEELEYPGTNCYCEYNEVEGICEIDGFEVDCEEYPGCAPICEVRDDGCYIGDTLLPDEECNNYETCKCERPAGSDTCYIDGVIVDCADYEWCPQCEVIDLDSNLCQIGDSLVSCSDHVDCPNPPEEPGNCPIRKIDELPYDTCKDGNTEGELADPPMCSILKNPIKNAYEMEEYGDSKYCDVYCRETYTFKFMDKETVQSGRYFRHDVEKKYVSVSYLSTVVTATQQCTSLIDYDQWKEDYMEANSDVRTTFNTLKYWESLYDLNGGQPTQIIDCGGGASGCNNCHWDNVCTDWQLIWRTGHYAETNVFAVPVQTTAAEAPAGAAAQCPQNVCQKTDEEGNCTEYKCVGTSRGPAKTVQQARGIDRDYVIKTHDSMVNAYNSAIDYRNSLINRLFNCNLYNDSEVSTFSDPGSYYTSKFAGNHIASPIVRSITYHDILQSYEPNSELQDLSYDDQVRLDQEGSASNVTFEKDIQPAIGTPGIEENKGYKTSAESNDPYDDTVCGGCDDPIHDSLSGRPKDDEEYGVLDSNEFNFWVCYDSLTGAHCDNEEWRISLMPKNYVANLEVTREIGYWQDTSFSTEIFTGKVIEGTGGLALPEKTWPVAIGTLTGDYNIFLRFNEFGDYRRKDGTLRLEFDTDVNCAYAVVNEMTKYDCDDGFHECYDCDDPSTPENECYPGGEDPTNPNLDLGFYFRAIDLDDVFPNSSYSPNQTLLNPNRPIGSNWTTTNAIQVIQEIQDIGNDIWVEKEPEYTVTLTPAMRKAIVRNNREIYKGDYLVPNNLTPGGGSITQSSEWLTNDLINILGDYNHSEYYSRNDLIRNAERKLYQRRS